MRRTRMAVALIAAVMLLAGCAEIPTSGPVLGGATQEPNGISIVYVPNPPTAGANQTSIVTGFIAAMSAGGGFTVAKKYLTTGFAAKWQPRSRVLVQESQSAVSTVGTNGIRLRVPISAQVSGNGVYTPTSTPQPLDFHLVQQNGQWRIDRAPNGIVLAESVFQRFYRPQQLQFFDQTWKRLVPDLRWFPVSSTSSAITVPSTRSIVDQLIAGPVGPVGGGVTSNALKGAKVDGIGSAGPDVTTVALTVPQVEPSADLIARMQQQLVQSLALPAPGALRLVLNGQVTPTAKALTTQSPLPIAYAISKGVFGTLAASGSLTADGALGKRIAAARPSAVTVSVRQGTAAVLTGDHRIAIVGPTSTTFVDSRPGQLIAPTMDQLGWVYSIPSDSPNGMQASNGKGPAIDLLAALPGTSVTSIEASPDGTRMLVLVATNTGPEAYVYGIQRDSKGAPTGLTTTSRYPVDLGGNTGAGIGATWVDDGSVAVLLSAANNSTDRVRLQQLGGTGSALGEIPNATSIVGTSGTDDLRILLQSGDVYVSHEQLWQQEIPNAPEVSVLAVQR